MDKNETLAYKSGNHLYVLKLLGAQFEINASAREDSYCQMN
jgi:hypothetical protein